MAVANIGQVIPNGDAKVFEVTIKVDGSDKDLRPAMTTSNVINTANLEEILFVPIEAVFTNDSLSYVYIKERAGKYRKQIIQTGISNENHIQIVEGGTEGATLLLNEPAESEQLQFEGIDIYTAMIAKKDSTDIN
jgi:multidrug efflux pump subunit AcrA (membrane-fusion protein)